MATRHVAILGGGITGLTSAFYVSRRFPDALVTVLEKSPTLGGWLKSERVDITSRSSVLLEAGPRSFRPGAKGLMELVIFCLSYLIFEVITQHLARAQINLLGLTPHLLTTPKSSPAARNRYLHLPPNRGLVAVPSSIWGALTSPLRSLLIPPILREALRAPNRPGSDCAEEHDESVDAFLTRRFGAEFARVFGSSLVHGIYAADARRVSMRAAFGRIWEMGERAGGSVVRGMVGQTVFGGRKPPKAHTYELGEVEERLRGVSIFSFRDGVGMIVDRLEQWLRARRGVRICVETSVSSLGYNPELDKFNVRGFRFFLLL